ncbi:threonine aldolase [Orenia metallireducens]|jgi:threonine aldolase|uniref:Threonine aldolase n=1 Tax=Orenia metallireducens TaxID=1413210 RepID=A0A1C0A9F9_9FIRM|nr:low-specificity L-threonine aldolase [Orenia metallireducens]OCL26920.1 threonine aldolase [Orenia metallireducens]
MKVIDLRSDTVTKPTTKMREVMAYAEVGDDVYGEDPTINKLEQKAAELVGKEAALFVASGTMGNLLAVMTHTQPGNEIILGKNSHIFQYEVGGLAKLAGVQARTLDDSEGIFSTKDLLSAIRGEDIHYPESGLVCLENTHNKAGGVAIPKNKIDEISKTAHQHNIPVHLDGARIFNAVTELEEQVIDLVAEVDSVMFCLSKGLAAPVGSILAGTQEFIDKARKNRKMLGGGMRQAGILAAAALVAIEEMIDRLALDHDLAKKLAEGIDSKVVTLESVNSNFVILKVNEQLYDTKGLITELDRKGIKVSQFGSDLLRVVTHKDISKEDIDRVIDIFSEL